MLIIIQRIQKEKGEAKERGGKEKTKIKHLHDNGFNQRINTLNYY